MIRWDIGTIMEVLEVRGSLQLLSVRMQSRDGGKDEGRDEGRDKSRDEGRDKSRDERMDESIDGDTDECKNKDKDERYAQAYHDLSIHPPAQRGDEVLLNTTAAQLGLGTGGAHFVHALLGQGAASVSRRQLLSAPAALPGHLIKLRYTSLQRAVCAVEAPESPYHGLFLQPLKLERTPVLIGELHSMLPAAVCWLRYTARRDGALPPVIAYVMSDGGALPLSFSSHATALKACGWIAGAVTYGHAYGGDLEALNKYTALLAAKHILRADVLVVTMGPGIAGTGTAYGHTAMEVGELVNGVGALGGLPIVIPRISFTDTRERHKGISHHLLNALSTAAQRAAVLPLPMLDDLKQRRYIEDQLQQYSIQSYNGLECCQRQHSIQSPNGLECCQNSSMPGFPHEIIQLPAADIAEIAQSHSDYPLKLTTMGRDLSQDPVYFQGVCASAEHAWNVLKANKWNDAKPLEA